MVLNLLGFMEKLVPLPPVVVSERAVAVCISEIVELSNFRCLFETFVISEVSSTSGKSPSSLANKAEFLQMFFGSFASFWCSQRKVIRVLVPSPALGGFVLEELSWCCVPRTELVLTISWLSKELLCRRFSSNAFSALDCLGRSWSEIFAVFDTAKFWWSAKDAPVQHHKKGLPRKQYEHDKLSCFCPLGDFRIFLERFVASCVKKSGQSSGHFGKKRNFHITLHKTAAWMVACLTKNSV